MIATERKGRLARIEAINVATMEAESVAQRRRWSTRWTRAGFDRAALDVCLLASGCCLAIWIVGCVALAVMGPSLIAGYEKSAEESQEALEAQKLRDQAAFQENRWILFRKQALIPGQSAIGSEGPAVSQEVWLQRANKAYAKARSYRQGAILQERFSQTLRRSL